MSRRKNTNKRQGLSDEDRYQSWKEWLERAYRLAWVLYKDAWILRSFFDWNNNHIPRHGEDPIIVPLARDWIVSNAQRSLLVQTRCLLDKGEDTNSVCVLLSEMIRFVNLFNVERWKTAVKRQYDEYEVVNPMLVEEADETFLETWNHQTGETQMKATLQRHLDRLHKDQEWLHPLIDSEVAHSLREIKQYKSPTFDMLLDIPADILDVICDLRLKVEFNYYPTRPELPSTGMWPSWHQGLVLPTRMTKTSNGRSNP